MIACVSKRSEIVKSNTIKFTLKRGFGSIHRQQWKIDGKCLGA